MKVKDIISEAAMSVGIQSRYPVSPGARGLMGARWRYDKVINNDKNAVNAVDQLEHNLKHIPTTDDGAINAVMRSIGEKFRIDPHELHQLFVKKYNCNPRAYAVKYKKSRIDKPIQI